DVNGVKVITYVGEENPDLFKSVVPAFKGKFTDVKFMFVVGTVWQGKPNITVVLSKPMVDAGYNAGNMVKAAAKFIQGGGGGQPFMASAGGKNPAGIRDAVESVVKSIAE
ncbi:MAG: alanine--tRNA ligase, partial [Paludibacteraceae bacterium]|nr:alanine--tRNA ligase [Paludibacteraceae bacterium]